MSDVYRLPEYRAFLAAIRAAPDDDLPRLVAADWMEERGEVERAEFIRVQVELAKGRNCGWGNGAWGCAEWNRIHRPGKPVVNCCDGCRRFDTMGKRETELALAADRSFGFRTARVVVADRSSVHGCCGQHADNKACDCSSSAVITSYHRGFVDRVSGPLLMLIGGECSHPMIWSDTSERCPACKGEGRTPGVLRKVLEREPVRSVEVTDREPVRVHVSGGYRPHGWDSGQFPPKVHESIRRAYLHYGELLGGPGSFLWYESGDGRGGTADDLSKANAALSAALLSLCSPEGLSV